MRVQNFTTAVVAMLSGCVCGVWLVGVCCLVVLLRCFTCTVRLPGTCTRGV